MCSLPLSVECGQGRTVKHVENVAFCRTCVCVCVCVCVWTHFSLSVLFCFLFCYCFCFFSLMWTRPLYSNPKGFCAWDLNPLTPELIPSSQRSLTRFFTEDFASWTVHFVNICVKNQQMQQLFMRIHTTSLDTTRPSTIFYRLLLNLAFQKALGTLPEDGNVMPKQVGATIRN
jgi:hypothetical protein